MKRVLVVEDSRTQAEELQMVLEEEFEVSLARDGSTALEMVKQGGFHAVVSDIMMPGLSGFQLCAAIKKDPATRCLPVILLTTLANPRDVLNGLEAGADNYITKPFDPDSLVQRLRLLTALDMALPEEEAPTVIESFGQTFTITADRSRVVRLLVSSLEDTVATNARLKVSQAEIASRNATLEELNREKNRFLGIAAHDLRNPIGAIQSFSEIMLSDDYPTSEEDRKLFLTQIRESSEFMLRLLGDLLDISKIEAGHLELDLRPADIKELLRKNISRNVLLANRKRIELRLDATVAPDTISIDTVKIEQVLNNLITNAIKFSHEGTAIDVIAAIDGQDLVISVRDQGQGIPTTEIDKLFKPFQRTSVTTTGGESSTGLGLAIVRRIVEGHRGRVWVTSEVGKGSCFAFTLPLRSSGA